MKNKKSHHKLKVIKNEDLTFDNKNSLDSELSFFLNMKKSDTKDKVQEDFAKNYSEENDDELNGLYAHYNIVKKT